MAAVHLMNVCSTNGIYSRIVESYGQRQSSSHQIVDDPSVADIILFAGSDRGDLRDVRTNPVYRRFMYKSFVLYEGDYCLPLVPGLYSGLDRWGHVKGWCEALHYTQVAFWDDLDGVVDAAPDLLYSFVGRKSTSRLRGRLVNINDGCGLISESPPSAASDYRAKYLDILARSRFILCPRGYGVSSFRIYEALRAGRVPVIISDDWVAPRGPEWSSCAVFIRERQMGSIRGLLKAREQEWDAMSTAARIVYHQWFSRASQFDRIVDWCSDLYRAPTAGAFLRFSQNWHRLRPSFVFRKLQRLRSSTGS